jgi:unsaturated chondroitin disaccharide hydrolase
VYTYTRDPADLAVAQRNADHFLARCPPGGVPPWDFDVPEGPDRIDDSSAAAIAASGLWNLARITADASRATRYRAAAATILSTLCTDRYMAWSTPGWEGVLKHGVYHFHKRLGVDESVMWGDYFFLEAVDKALASNSS